MVADKKKICGKYLKEWPRNRYEKQEKQKGSM